MYTLYKNYYLINEIGIASKVCVSIFVMLSSYVLAVSVQSLINISIFTICMYNNIDYFRIN